MWLELEDNHDAMEWAIGMYTWLSHNHEGMSSDKYSAMSRMIGEYKLYNVPDIDVDDDNSEEDYKAISTYHHLTEDNWSEYFDQWVDFMDNWWDEG